LTLQGALLAVPVLDQLCVLVVTDPGDIRLRVRVAPEYHWFDVPLDFALKAMIGAEGCASWMGVRKPRGAMQLLARLGRNGRSGGILQNEIVPPAQADHFEPGRRCEMA